MFAQIQSYLRGLSKTGEDSSLPRPHHHNHSTKRLLNFSQNDQHLAFNQSDMIEAGKIQERRESGGGQRIDTDRTIRNSLFKSDINNQNNNSSKLVGPKRKIKDGQHHYNFEKQALINSERMSKITLYDQRTIALKEKNMIVQSPKVITRESQQDDLKQTLKMDFKEQFKLGAPPKGIAQKQRYGAAVNDLSREDTEEDLYKFYLNSGNQKDQMLQNSNMRETVINDVNSFNNQAQVQRAINIYQKEIRQNYDANNASTPTNQFYNQKTQEHTKTIHQNQHPNLSQKYASNTEDYGSPHMTAEKKNFSIKRHPNRQSSNKNYNKGEQLREMTYESERSSIFNENVQQVETVNRNNFNHQYALKNEENKKSYDISNSVHEFENRADSSRSISQHNPKVNLQILSHQNNNNNKIQQMLELNLRLSNLNTLNDSLFSKNQFLRTVDIRNNLIKELPDAICDLNILWKLRVDYNIIEKLPEKIGNLERLEVLTASNNKLTALPLSLFKLNEKLGMLQLNDNLIKKIQPEIGHLNQLKVLLLHNNLLQRIPNQIYHLQLLHEFSLEWFSYLQPPINKILKDERGQIIIKDFLKFCKQMHDIQPRIQCRFIHFIAYHFKLNNIDSLIKLNSFPKGRSILHYLCLYGHLHLFKDIMKAVPNFNINHQDQDGTTPLVLAFKNKQNAIIQYMMNYPITNLNIGSSKYGYPIHVGIKNNEFKIVQQMLKPKYVVNINAKDDDGNNAMHFLMGHFGYDTKTCAKIGVQLLKKGIEVNILNKQEFSPLHIAIKSFQLKSLKFALDFNTYIRSLSQLHSPFDNSEQRRLSSINPFQKNKFQTFNFNIKGKNQWSMLHYAVFNNNLHAVELILHAQRLENIDIFARDSEGKLPQELCPYNSPIYKMIISYQRKVIANKTKTLCPVIKEEKKDSNHKSNSGPFIHKYINRRYNKRLEKAQHSGKHQHILRRVNSNRSVNQIGLLQYDSNNVMQFGVIDLSDEESSQLEESNKHKIRDSIIKQDKANKFRNRTVEKGVGVHQTLQQSKTEKFLHSGNLMFTSNNVGLTKERGHFSRFAPGQKASPRLQQQIPPLAPKRQLNNEDDQDIIMDEVLNRYDNQRFMSNPINFDSEENLTKDDIFTQSLTIEESSEQEENDDYFSELRRSQSDGFKPFEQTEKIELRNIEKLEGNKVFEIKNEQYKSAPARRKNNNANKQLSAEQQIQDAKLLEENKEQDTKEQDLEDEEEDFCDADEDAEAGAMGIIANKINKFDNHNVEQDYKSINEKDILIKIIEELKLIDIKKKQNKNLQKMRLTNAKQIISQQIDIIKSFDQNPFDSQILNEESPEIEYTKEDEGNVFDTVEHYSILTAKDNQKSNIQEQIQKLQKQSKQSHNNDLNLKNYKEIPKTYRNNSSSIIGQRRNTQGLVNPSMKEDQNKNQTTSVFGKLKNLNKDCHLEDSDLNKLTVDDIINKLNSEDINISQKYQIIYSLIYSKNSEQVLDESALRQLYLSFEDNYASSIIKADLLYLISLSKRKEFIPQLDSAIKEYKKQSFQQDNSEIKYSRAKSPEPMITSSALGFSEKDLKTPNNRSMIQSNLRTHHQQSNCKKLVIYETQNAFDMLMQEAMIQSKQMMDECNNRIYYERERSREKMKIKAGKSQRTQYQMTQSMSGGDLQIPLNVNQVRGFTKSPSQQVIINNKKHQNMSSYVYQPPNDGGSDFITNFKQPNNISQDISFTIGNTIFPKKTSFTPKGSSGQLFLAFQRQKQQTKDQIAMIGNDSNRFSPKIGETLESAHYTKQSNFDEEDTPLFTNRPQDIITQTKQNLDVKQEMNHMSLNSSISNLNQSSNHNSSQKQQSYTPTLANVIVYSINELQQKPITTIGINMIDKEKINAVANVDNFDKDNNKRSGGIGVKSNSQHKYAIHKQKELSQQIKNNIQNQNQRKNQQMQGTVINLSSNKVYQNNPFIDQSATKPSQAKSRQNTTQKKGKIAINKVSPNKMKAHDISIERVEERIKKNLSNISSTNTQSQNISNIQPIAQINPQLVQQIQYAKYQKKNNNITQIVDEIPTSMKLTSAQLDSSRALKYQVKSFKYNLSVEGGGNANNNNNSSTSNKSSFKKSTSASKLTADTSLMQI